jgi:hypothetical protein
VSSRGPRRVPAEYGGEKYQQAVIAYVNTVTADGLYAIVELHWSAPGSMPARVLRPMPDADHSPDFWRSVATASADNPNVVFDLFNEPFGVDEEVAPLLASVPVLVSEFGTDWTPTHGDDTALQLMDWADERHIGYLAWTWNTWGSGDALISSNTGEMTRWGSDFKAHLGRHAQPTP